MFERGSSGGAGGAGGGGAGGRDANATNGTANLGGGGGGTGRTIATATAFNGGTGGSGVVILRYLDTFTITFGAGVTGTESAASGGFKRATITAATAGNVSFA